MGRTKPAVVRSALPTGVRGKKFIEKTQEAKQGGYLIGYRKFDFLASDLGVGLLKQAVKALEPPQMTSLFN